jgi:hypothetical protein
VAVFIFAEIAVPPWPERTPINPWRFERLDIMVFQIFPSEYTDALITSGLPRRAEGGGASM